MNKKTVKKPAGPVKKPISKKVPKKKIYAEPKLAKSQQRKVTNAWNPSRMPSRGKPR
ncbi:MAG: hypothetical protein WCJ58_01305 [bacterium]